MCRPNIEYLIGALRRMVECSPKEFLLKCRRFNGFVFLDGGLDQLNEPRLGTNEHSLSRYDYLRDKEIFTHPVLAMQCKLTEANIYQVTLHALDVYSPEFEHKYLGCDKCKKRNKKAVINDMRIALTTLLETLPSVQRECKEDCKPNYVMIGESDNPSCCNPFINALDYQMNEFTRGAGETHCYIGVKAVFYYNVGIECDDFVFERKDQ